MIQITRKSSKSVKMTIAKDRVALKLPENLNQSEIDSIYAVAQKICANVGTPSLTVRGSFKYGGITLVSENRKIVYKFDEEGNRIN